MRRPLLAFCSATLLCALAVMSSVAFAQSAVTRPLPQRLSDAEFWGLVTSASEPGGSFPSDNFTSNEMGFPNLIARMQAERNVGGAYLGVGPEQNFSYIAGLRPQIAFLVDIRRQSVIQHLMYKAIFELSTDRADFVSMLFSKSRPAGLDSTTTIALIWDAYWNVPTDTPSFRRNLARITAHLTQTHGFALDSADRASLSYVYEAFYQLGPRITYGGYGGGVGATLAGIGTGTARYAVVRSVDSVITAARAILASVQSVGPGNVITGTVRDAVTGKGISRATVTIVGLGLSAITDDSGSYRIGGLSPGVVVSVQATRLGFGVMRSDVKLDQPVVTANMTLVQSAVSITGVGSVTLPSPVLVPGSIGGGITSYYGGTNFASLTASIDAAGVPRSFLASERDYRYMKDLHTRNLFIPVVGDFAGPKAIRAVGAYLRDHGTTISAFYTSNVEQYLFSGGSWTRFYQNVETLPVTPSSVFIRNGSSTCPITAFLAAVSAGRVKAYGDATRCVL